MTIKTKSKFFYGHVVDETNFALDFSEGGAELQASLNIGDYSASEYPIEVARAMNFAGSQLYVATLIRMTRLVTVSAPGNFELLINSGSRSGASTYSLMGFTGADRTGANTYTGNTGTGSEYKPQRVLRDYIDPADNNDVVEAMVNESGAGDIQVFTFGDKVLTVFDIQDINSLAQGGHSVIEENLNGKADANAFMNNAILKARIEFMPDRNNPDTFFKLFLEKTAKNSKGVGYQLYKQFKPGVEGYFRTKLLTWRVVE